MSTDNKNQVSAKTGERTLLGFDFGTKRIGIAIGQELTATASGIDTIRSIRQKPDWDRIQQLIEQWQPNALVVGIPLHMDNTPHQMTARAEKFCRQLHARYNLPVYQVDERLSSFEAESILNDRKASHGKQHNNHDTDRMAAQIILQTWLDSQ